MWRPCLPNRYSNRPAQKAAALFGAPSLIKRGQHAQCGHRHATWTTKLSAALASHAIITLGSSFLMAGLIGLSEVALTTTLRLPASTLAGLTRQGRAEVSREAMATTWGENCASPRNLENADVVWQRQHNLWLKINDVILTYGITQFMQIMLS